MHPLRIVGMAAGFLIFVAALLPWATVSFFGAAVSARGVESVDGVIALLAGIAIGVLVGLWKRATLIGAAAASGVVVLIALVNMVQVITNSGELGMFGSVRPGIGLILTLLLGIGAGVVSFMGIMASRDGAAAPVKAPWSQQAGPQTSLPPATLPPASAPPATPAQPTGPQTSLPPATLPPTPPAPTVPAGWYPDPMGKAPMRYWDGAAWTDHTS